jgi:hypothetical protein
MSRSENRTEPKLPVTAEVGGEGGSFADPTVQVATQEGDIANEDATAGDRVPTDVVESDTASGMRKYPTEK